MNMEHVWRLKWSREGESAYGPAYSEVFWSELAAWSAFNRLVTNYDFVDLDKLVPVDDGTGGFETVKVYSFDRTKAFTDWS